MAEFLIIASWWTIIAINHIDDTLWWVFYLPRGDAHSLRYRQNGTAEAKEAAYGGRPARLQVGPGRKSRKTGRIVERVLEIGQEIIDKASRSKYLGVTAPLYEQGARRRPAGGGIGLTGW
jgi:hypothetical protein